MARRGWFLGLLILVAGLFGCGFIAPFIISLTGLPASITIPASVVLTATGGPGSSSGLWTWTFSTTCGGTFTSTTLPNNGPANPIIIGWTDLTIVQVTYHSAGATPGVCTFTATLTIDSGGSASTSQTTTVTTAPPLFWAKSYGGPGTDSASSIQQTIDGGFIVAGTTASFGAGGEDFWVLKLNPDGTVPPLGADTFVSPADTNATVIDTSASVSDTSATVTDTNALVTDTNATVMQQAP